MFNRIQTLALESNIKCYASDKFNAKCFGWGVLINRNVWLIFI